MPDTVFSHLVMRFTAHPENLATEALAFILGRSPKAQAALVTLIGQFGVTLPAGLIIQTQAGGEDGARPDLVGLAGADQPLLIEAKFWAGLTDKQPVAYVKRLPAGGILLFVTPAARLSLVWEELLHRASTGSLSPVERASPMSESYVATVAGQQTMAIVSWRALLDCLKAPLQLASDAPTREDIAQLEGLCERQDADAFMPVSHEELSNHIYRRVIQFQEMVEPIVDILIKKGIVVQQRASRDAWVGYLGRWVEFSGHWLFLDCNVNRWMAYASTPFWLTIAGSNWQKPPPPTTMTALAPLLAARPPRLFIAKNGLPTAPLHVPPGAERDAVIESIVAQVQALVSMLPSNATASSGTSAAAAGPTAPPPAAVGPGATGTPVPGSASPST